MYKNIYIIILLANICNVQGQDKLEYEIIDKTDKHITNTDSIPINYYDSLLEVYPNSLYLMSMRACNMVSQGNIEEASKYIKTNVTELENNSFVLMTLGIINQQSNKKDYVKYFHKSLDAKFSEKNKWVYIYLYQYYKEIDDEKANKYLYDALKIDSEFTHALLEISYSLNQIDDCKEIIKNMELVYDNYKNHEVASFLGNAYFNCFNREKAEFYFNKSNELIVNSDAYLGLAHIKEFEDKEKDEALNFYKKSLELNEENTTALMDVAWLCYDLGKGDESEKYLQKYLTINNNQESFNEIIYFYLTSNDVLKAKTYNDQSIKINKSNFYNEGFKIVIKIMENKGEWEESISKDIRYFESKYDNTESNWLKQTIDSISNRQIR